MELVPLSSRDATEALDGVHLTQLAAGEKMSVQHYKIDPDGVVHEHSHPHEQTGYLIEGELVFISDGEETVVEGGDSYTIPGDEPHAVENRTDEPAIGVELFSPARANPPWEE